MNQVEGEKEQTADVMEDMAEMAAEIVMSPQDQQERSRQRLRELSECLCRSGITRDGQGAWRHGLCKMVIKQAEIQQLQQSSERRREVTERKESGERETSKAARNSEHGQGLAIQFLEQMKRTTTTTIVKPSPPASSSSSSSSSTAAAEVVAVATIPAGAALATRTQTAVSQIRKRTKSSEEEKKQNGTISIGGRESAFRKYKTQKIIIDEL